MLWTYRYTRAGFILVIAVAFLLFKHEGHSALRFLYHCLLFFLYAAICTAQSSLDPKGRRPDSEWLGRQFFNVVAPAFLLTGLLYYTYVSQKFHIYDLLSWIQILFCYTMLVVGEYRRRLRRLPFF